MNNRKDCCGQSFQRVDKPVDTLADVEKGRDISAKQIRRRTGASLFCGKASNAAESSMFSAAFFILLKYLQLFFYFFHACGRPTFSTV